MTFHMLKHAISAKFDSMKKNELYTTKVSGDNMWETYLSSFPVGTDNLFRQRTEHNCGCCKQFIRAMGNVVSIKNNKLDSIWDIKVDDPTYQVVADSLAKFAKSESIEDVFLHYETKIGTDKNYEEIAGKVTTWDHFHVKITDKGQNSSIHFCEKSKIPAERGKLRTTYEVMDRALNEIKKEDVDTVLDLIKQNSIYRGEEHKFVVESFAKLQKEFLKLPGAERNLFVWGKIKSTPGSVSGIRNSAIGSLLVDLSSNMELENAVGSFEAKVAPSNYKRPTALVTKKMVENAKEKIKELGLTTALERRYAKLTDITINNILFANREDKKVIEGDVFDSIVTKSATPKNLDKVDEITIDKFLSDILPNAESIEVMFENKHTGNLVSLVTSADPDSGKMFKWDNNFSWSYNGDFADSIKERVKKAGGSVTGDLCCRLAWFNHDDLDFHMIEPNGYEISFRTRTSTSPSGGKLDVDMNAGYGQSRTPVENIVYQRQGSMREGPYHLFVHNYNMRETKDVGFEVEIDWLGDNTSYVYDKALRTNEKVTVMKFKYSKKSGIEIVESLNSTKASKIIWNIPTQQFVKVNVLMNSPNHWDNKGTGNKHYFFMLDGCLNDGTARGFFNEFLKEELTPHRKVIEMVGSKMRTEESANQLSGLGFSSTKRDEILVRVKGSFTRVVKVII